MKKTHYIIAGVVLVSVLGYLAYKKFGGKGDKGKNKDKQGTQESSSTQETEVTPQTEKTSSKQNDGRVANMRFKSKEAMDAYLKGLEKTSSASPRELELIRKMSA